MTVSDAPVGSSSWQVLTAGSQHTMEVDAGVSGVAVGENEKTQHHTAATRPDLYRM